MAIQNEHGLLTILESKMIKGRRHYICQCECGNTTTVRTDSVDKDKTRSCGCLLSKSTADRQRTHGLSYNPVSRVLQGMIHRCYDPEHSNYPYYGGRGIVVCERWRDTDGVTNFHADMGDRPSSEHSIDRIDNDGNYSCGKCKECIANEWPANCRWATRDEQYANRSDNHKITFNGRTHTLAQWAKEIGLGWDTLKRRFDLGWTIEQALTTPLHKRKTQVSGR